MKARVYIETSIPSFYYEIRQEPEMVARRQWTRYWWDHERGKYDLVTSEAVIIESSRGDIKRAESGTDRTVGFIGYRRPDSRNC